MREFRCPVAAAVWGPSKTQSVDLFVTRHTGIIIIIIIIITIIWNANTCWQLRAHHYLADATLNLRAGLST